MRVLITGATGFIGGKLAALPAGEGVSIPATYRLTSDTHTLHASDVEMVQLDLTASGAGGLQGRAREAVRGCTHVIHLAAVRDGAPEALVAGRRCFETNTL